MKLEISGSLMFTVAEHCVEVIHSHMVQMHLRRSWGIWEDATGENPYPLRDYQKQAMQEVQAVVRSIDISTPEDSYERRSFCRSLRFLLNKKCEEKGTARKWQDYIASVKAAKAAHDANQPKFGGLQ